MHQIAIYPGFNDRRLQVKVSSLPSNSDLCAVVFDEMAIKEQVTYNPKRDEVEGLEILALGCDHSW